MSSKAHMRNVLCFPWAYMACIFIRHEQFLFVTSRPRQLSNYPSARPRNVCQCHV